MAKLAILLTWLVVLASYSTTISAHLAIRTPLTRRSIYSPYYASQQHCVSDNLVTPLGFQGKFTFPCRGFAPGPTQANWTAGQPISVEIIPSANHHGGNCELAISYDNVNFAVFYQSFDYCLANCVSGDPASCTLNVTLPANLPPSPNAVLAWSWIARQGNREYFHGCSDIQIVAPAHTTASQGYTGPKLLVANYPGYPIIFEFNQTYNGIELYQRQPNITIAPTSTKSISKSNAVSKSHRRSSKVKRSADTCPLPAVPIGDITKLSSSLPVPGTPCNPSDPSRCVDPTDPGLNGLLFLACDGDLWQEDTLSAGMKCVQTQWGMMGYSLSAGDLTDDN